jgi:acyl-CoA synthetase (NDP forming)
MLVNPRHIVLAGLPVYADIAALPSTPDLAVIATPPDTVARLKGVHDLFRRDLLPMSRR